MNINYFFLFLIICLSMIFFLFKPLEQIEKNIAEVPSLELNHFRLSELNVDGLTSSMHGEKGIKFNNRYIVKQLNYTDNTNDYLSNIKANNALYKDLVLNLEGDIKYVREDGLAFTTQKAIYDKETNIIISSTKFMSQLSQNTIQGDYLEYDIGKNIMNTKNVIANYRLKERK